MRGSWSPAAGAAGTAIVTLLLAAGVTDVVVWDREGCLAAEPDGPVAGQAASSPRSPTRAA